MGKKSLDQKIDEILNTFSKEDFLDFSDDFSIIADAVGVLECELKDSTDCKTEIVYYLSLFAEKYAKLLTVLIKKYPKIYDEIEDQRESPYHRPDWEDSDDVDDEIY